MLFGFVAINILVWLLNVGLKNGTKVNERNMCVWERDIYIKVHACPYKFQFWFNFNFVWIYYISLECCFVILVLVDYWMIRMSQWPMEDICCFNVHIFQHFIL
jgi:hypothetical protein